MLQIELLVSYNIVDLLAIPLYKVVSLPDGLEILVD